MFGDCKETIPIGKVCSLHSRIGWQALTKAEHMTTGEYMLITGTDFKDGVIDYSGCKHVSKDRYEMDPNIIIQNGDVLVTKDGTIGKVAVVKDLPKPATLNAGVFVVRNTDNQFLTEFIQQCLLSSNFQRFIESVKRGATIVHLNQEKFLKYELPVADLNLQHQFVGFVQQVDKSKAIAKQCFDKFDTLVKSRFIEMFGTLDEPKVPTMELGDVAIFVNGYAFKPTDWGSNGLPIIRIQNLSGSSNVFNYYSGEYPKDIEINSGDIMISWSATLGVFVWNGPKALLNQHIFKVYFDKIDINPTYFCKAVEVPLLQAKSKTHGSTMTHLTKKTFNSIRIPVPSKEKQNEFATFVEQVDKSKFMRILLVITTLYTIQAGA